MNKLTIAMLTLSGALAVGCLQAQAQNDAAATQPAKKAHKHNQTHKKGCPFMFIKQAVAVLHPTEGNETHGTVSFEQTKEGVRVVADVYGLEPGSTHGFHIHQYGDCSAPDGTSAGGHYNPDGHEHGLPDAADVRHAGDLGNLEANDEGYAHKEILVDNITLAGPEAPILGRGLIVHAQADTGEQPTGGAGPRIACGVIGVANPGE